MDDPEGWYPRVSTDWNVAEKILLSRTEADGGNVPCKWLIFGPGDFVDVAASFDVCYRGQKGVNVTLNILQVVLVIPKAEDVSPLPMMLCMNTVLIGIKLGTTDLCRYA